MSKVSELLNKLQVINESFIKNVDLEDWKKKLLKKHPKAKFEEDDFEIQAFVRNKLVGAYDTNDKSGVID